MCGGHGITWIVYVWGCVWGWGCVFGMSGTNDSAAPIRRFSLAQKISEVS